jgi:transposase
VAQALVDKCKSLQSSFADRGEETSPEDLAKEFEPSAQAIRNWVAQADRDEGRRGDGLTNAERIELSRLRKENKQLRLEREILSKAAAWFARETKAVPSRGSDS